MSSEYKLIDLADIRPSPLNPRKTFDAGDLRKLTENIKAKGVLVPLLVRKNGTGSTYELVAGERRWRAAIAAALTQVPAIIRTLTDQETLEIMVIENSQRKDVHPLEEAMGYRALMATYKNHGEKAVDIIAGKVGMSVKYVYDRVKLCNLIPEAQKLFLADRITAGHAILLARLSAADQKRCIDPERAGQVYGRIGGLWTGESTLFDPDADHAAERADKYDELKAVSVRELAGWIDEHVKFDTQAVEPLLFPETAAVLARARNDAAKVIHITHEHFVQPDAKDGKERIFGPKSWTRADGRHGSKPCEHSVLGVIVAGPGRGQAFDVCTDKHTCTVHYGKEIKERAQREKAGGGAPAQAQHTKDTYARQRAQEEAQEKLRATERMRWEKAYPKLMEALAASVRKAPTKANGLLAGIIMDAVSEYHPSQHARKAFTLVPRGATAEDVLRHAAFIVLATEASHSYRCHETFPKRMKAFGLDAKKILDQAAPVVPPAASQAKGKTVHKSAPSKKQKKAA